MKTKYYGWKATDLASHLTMEELVLLQAEVQNDPKSKNPDHDGPRQSIYLYTKPARRKLDALGWAITYKLAERKVQ